MNGARVPFDSSLPVIVAGAELMVAGERFAVDQPFPWRKLGMSELELLQLHFAGKVECVAPSELDAPAQKKKRTPRAPQPTE